MDIVVRKEFVFAEEIECGEVFCAHDDCYKYYMVINCMPKTGQAHIDNSVAAVNLASGNVTYFNKEKEVCPVSAKVVIDGGDEG